jgi:hypothetical protein
LSAPLAAAILLVATALPAAAQLRIDIDKSTQRMIVSIDGAPVHNWPVSTGTRRYDTPSGQFKPFRMERHHFSREWDNAPMPHSIFFTQVGHAIHGTTHLRAIGRPASHGCVRLEPQNARLLFALVRRHRMANTSVVLSGVTPEVIPPAVARRAPQPTRPARPRRDEGEETRAARRDALEHAPGEQRIPGFWVQYPDGRREFYESERDPRYVPPPPPRLLFPGPPPIGQ